MGYRLCRLPCGAPSAAAHACYTPCARDREGASQACANKPIRIIRGSKGSEREKRKNKQEKAARRDTRSVYLGYLADRGWQAVELCRYVRRKNFVLSYVYSCL